MGLDGPASSVGRAFTVRQPSSREAVFSKAVGTPKMSDLKAPTYKYRHTDVLRCRVMLPVGPRRSGIPRRSGLYGPTVTFSRSDIFKTIGTPKMLDLKAPTYKYRHADALRCRVMLPVGPGRSDIPRRSGLYGPTAIFSRSDIFKSRWHSEDVGPEGTDLQIPTRRRFAVPRDAPRWAWTVRHPP